MKHSMRDFSCNFSWYFSQRVKNGPSSSGSPCKLSPVLDNTVQSHKSMAHPLFQEHCRASDEGNMLYFPGSKGKWSHHDYMMMKKRNAWKSSWAVFLLEQSIPASPSCRLFWTNTAQATGSTRGRAIGPRVCVPLANFKLGAAASKLAGMFYSLLTMPDSADITAHTQWHLWSIPFFIFTSISQHTTRNAQELLKFMPLGIRDGLSPSTVGPDVLPALQPAHQHELGRGVLVSVLTGGFTVGLGHWQCICYQTWYSLTWGVICLIKGQFACLEKEIIIFISQQRWEASSIVTQATEGFYLDEAK